MRLSFGRCTLVGSCAALLLACASTAIDGQQVKDFPLNYGDAGKQPEVYWHDADVSFDLDTSTNDWKLAISHQNGAIDRVPLPPEIKQVDAIHRSGSNRAVVVTELGSGMREILVIQIDQAQVLDTFMASGPVAVSPSNQYVIFVRYYPMHGAEGYDDQYRVYDVLGTRATNWPDRPAQDSPPNIPASYDDSLAGVPVYPLAPGELGRRNTFVPENEAHTSISDYVWTADSSKVLFADVQGDNMRFVVVAMPSTASGKMHTSAYQLQGTENVCSGGNECDDKSVRSLTWNGATVEATLLFQPEHARSSEVYVSVPLSRFVPEK